MACNCGNKSKKSAKVNYVWVKNSDGKMMKVKSEDVRNQNGKTVIEKNKFKDF